MLTTQELKERLRKLKESRVDLKIEREYFEDDKPIQLVFRTKPRPIIYLRAKPKTAYRPTPAQIRARLRFGELAKKAKGKKFKVNGEFVSDLPPAAEMVKAMRGERFGETVKPKKWQMILLRTIEVLGEEVW